MLGLIVAAGATVLGAQRRLAGGDAPLPRPRRVRLGAGPAAGGAGLRRSPTATPTCSTSPGPSRTAHATAFGADDLPLELRSLPGAAFVLTAGLLPLRLSDRARRPSSPSRCARWRPRARWAAQPLGVSGASALPLARPALAAGAALAVMETLADYGAVHFLGVQTLTTGVVRAWSVFGAPGRGGAAVAGAAGRGGRCCCGSSAPTDWAKATAASSARWRTLAAGADAADGGVERDRVLHPAAWPAACCCPPAGWRSWPLALSRTPRSCSARPRCRWDWRAGAAVLTVALAALIAFGARRELMEQADRQPGLRHAGRGHGAGPAGAGGDLCGGTRRRRAPWWSSCSACCSTPIRPG